MSSSVDEAVAALRSGKLAIVPTDTVYGLAADPDSESSVSELSRLKGRHETQPIALMVADLGFPLAQGHHHGRPGPAGDIDDLLVAMELRALTVPAGLRP